RMSARSLPMICANPDVVVERGDKLVYCAGAIADPYAAEGGEVIYAGKPYRPIYEQALALAEAARGSPAEHHRLLAIGDSVRTDLKGAPAFGIDCLFVTAGIHAEELGDRHDPDATALSSIFAAAGVAPKAVMHRLSWELPACLKEAAGLAMTGAAVIKLPSDVIRGPFQRRS